MSIKTVKNVAIIAHVDHGKTSLIDSMLKQSGTLRDNENLETCAMDSNTLERERGITMFSKCASIIWNDVKINIVDTPGHADFGGEVERILNMVDSALLLVDAAEGPMPQTKFVLNKALQLGLKPIVVINKIDKADARIEQVCDEILDLFISLDASDEQVDFPLLYASGRDGFAVKDYKNDARENLIPLFDTILDHIPVNNFDVNEPFKMLATLKEHDPYLGRLLIGRIRSGKAKINANIKSLNIDGELIENGKITKLFAFQGMKKVVVEEVNAGDIVVLAGCGNTNVSDTLCDNTCNTPIAADPIDPPIISVTIMINDSPFAGKEGSKLTSNMVKDRLHQEAENSTTIQIKPAGTEGSFEVSARGELQIGVLIETMRREGFELLIGRPKVILKQDENNNKTLEPYEEVQIDLESDFVGKVVEAMNLRKAQLTDMSTHNDSTRLTFIIPARGLIGYYSQFLTDTRGTGVMNRIFLKYDEYCGDIFGRRNGALIASHDGVASGYALSNLEERGELFIKPGDNVYQGMIIGEHNRENDLEVNPTKAKQLTNIRSVNKDDAIRLTPPRIMTIEQAISYIQDDELVEVTPSNARLRKTYLLPHERKKRAK